MYPYHLRKNAVPTSDQEDEEFSVDEMDAATSPTAPSSPISRGTTPTLGSDEDNGVRFRNLPILPEDDNDDEDYIQLPDLNGKPKSRLTLEEKVLNIYDYMCINYPRLSLIQFLETLFTKCKPPSGKPDSLSIAIGRFMGEGVGPLRMMDVWWESMGQSKRERMEEWAVDRAASVCRREAVSLSKRGLRGKNAEDARKLRVPARSVTVDITNRFRLQDLNARYERTTPHLQKILKTITQGNDVGKQGLGSHDEDEGDDDEKPDEYAGRNLVTSILLNLHSGCLNYQPAMFSLLFWDHRVPKRVVQLLNKCGLCMSYTWQSKALDALSSSALAAARLVAQDPSKFKVFPYDNINWKAKTHEPTMQKKTITHDEVSALLIAVPVPEALKAHISLSPTPNLTYAQYITAASRFKERADTRHNLPHDKALRDIVPNRDDEAEFHKNAIIHVQTILCEEFEGLSRLSKDIAAFFDERAIDPSKLEQYYLPCFDQEQSSTRGNMIALEHYFREVLSIPKEDFEAHMYTVLGDRLTTSRDRAAQDQRSVDRSSSSLDRLSCFQLVSGLMHMNLNFMEGVVSNAWGAANADPVSLASLAKELPNRKINPKKSDYYEYLRFFDVVLRSLVIRAASTSLKIPATNEAFKKAVSNFDQLKELSSKIVDEYVLAPPARLEDLGIKVVPGNTTSGHAVLLLHDLMTLREMVHSTKHGHPTRIIRMIKRWLPMYYAAGRYNYAHECMELLHNILHDWPEEYAWMAVNSMVVNPSGRHGHFKATDIHVEHLNAHIKEHVQGPNASPEHLEKITPAMGYVSNLTNNIFGEMGVEAQNQRHAKVVQHGDVAKLVEYLSASKIFDFAADVRESEHAVVDLYRSGLDRLAGDDGAHMTHLKRHALRSRNRFTSLVTPAALDSLGVTSRNQDETLSRDTNPPPFNTEDAWGTDGAEIVHTVENM